MLRFETNPSMKEKVLLIHALKRDVNSCSMLKPNTEENNIVAIYDNDSLCGGVLILGKEKPAYLYCFFNSPDYCAGNRHAEVKALIAASFSDIKLFDVYHIRIKNNT